MWIQDSKFGRDLSYIFIKFALVELCYLYILMRSIHLKHFRCYSDFELVFRPGINLLVGDNASGKTSLLKACQYVLSAFFAGFSDENTNWITFDTDDFQRLVEEERELPTQPIQIIFDATDLDYTGKKDLSSQRLERRKPKGARTLRTGFELYYLYSQQLQLTFYSFKEKRQIAPLPLFAYYSVEDIHAKRRINTTAFSRVAKHSLGYLGCLNGDGFLRYWIHRLLILEEKTVGHQESTFVTKSILRVIGEHGCNLFKDILIRINAKEVVFVTIDGREIPTDYLSEGQKRIVAMAIDLAFRSYLLNYSLYGEETCAKISGTVLIDEVDMHLHPSLQAKILPALRRAYPNVQFIASSHAPMVMSGIKSDEENVVYRLSYDEDASYQVGEVSTYGLDLSTLVERLWELPPRTVEVAERLNGLFKLIDDEEYEKANDRLNELQEDFPDGGISDLSYAEGLLTILVDSEK